MRIAICDDCPKEQQVLLDMLCQHRPSWQTICFSCGEDLLEAIGGGRVFDFIFLDIYMGGCNGFDTAKALRNMACHTPLVFITTSRDFAVESYEVEALSYLVKPVSSEALLQVLQRFETAFRPKQIRLGPHLVGVSDILYLESHDKKVMAHLKDAQKIWWTAKLSDVEEMLVAKQFLRCHRSYIVNMDAVSGVRGKSFKLLDGTELPIKRQAVNEIINLYYQYIVD